MLLTNRIHCDTIYTSKLIGFVPKIGELHFTLKTKRANAELRKTFTISLSQRGFLNSEEDKDRVNVDI